MKKKMIAPIFVSVRDLHYGSAAIGWSISEGMVKVSRIFLFRTGASSDGDIGEIFPDSRLSSCRDIEEVGNSIEGIFNGHDIKLNLSRLDLDCFTPFQRKVLTEVVFKIRRGSVMTYREVAERIGLKNGARAVAGAVASNPFPIIIPCHRVIRSDGKIGGYLGGEEMKTQLLRMEGIEIDERGRVNP